METDNKKKSSGLNLVFIISIVISLLITVYSAVYSAEMGALAQSLMNAATTYFGWFYLSLVAFFIGFSLWLAFSRYGKIVLGPDGCKPDFSTVSWFAMLFGSGMGIGIIFWGFAEPITHFANPPFGIAPGTEEAAEYALMTVVMHWAIHPWSCFAVMGLALAYFQFRKGKPGLVSSVFIPLIGEKRANGPAGKLIDIIAVLATILGVCTSLGLGTMQINGGLTYLAGIPSGATSWLFIIAVIAVIYIWTAVSGVDKGIQLIGNINLYLAMFLLLSCFIIGPTLLHMNALANTFGMYFQNIIFESFRLKIFDDNSWTMNWRVFYWAWWLAWAPFVGTFIARISRGRTIREFVLGVLIIPSAVCAVWCVIFGIMGMNLIKTLPIETIASYAKDPASSFVSILSHYPMTTFFCVIVMCLVITFFVTSANSATYVLGMLSDEGRMFPSKKKMFFWGIVEAAMAYFLMISSPNGLSSLQTASIAGAFPFLFVMIGGCISLVKALRAEFEDAQ